MDPSPEPPFKKLKLSLESPYVDDNGETIATLLDITPQGEHVFEPKDDPSKSLGETLRRVFEERGLDFFDKVVDGQGFGASANDDKDVNEDDNTEPEISLSAQAMTTTELYKMRCEIIPNLRVALGEMAQAKELLTLLLDSTSQAQAPPVQSAFALAQGTAAPVAATAPSNLTATNIAKSDPIVSVAAFNKQLVIGGKDEALRKASASFKTASESIERARLRGEKYWVDALKIRKANWGLIPAPLPFGSATGKGADKTSKDFLVSFGLEESPPHFRQRAVGRMSTYETESGALVFPLRQNTRLRVSLSITNPDGTKAVTHNTPRSENDDTLDLSLKAAQQEITEHEIFTALVKEAGQLPTASARVSERIIAIEAAENVELVLEMVDSDLLENPGPETSGRAVAVCDLVYHLLHALLLRLHAHVKRYRLGTAGIVRPPEFRGPIAPPLLQPIIDLLQYQTFCERIRVEVDKVVAAMSAAGIPASLRFDVIGESGEELVRMFDEEVGKHVGGEAVLRIDNRHTVRLTLLSPSTLVAHLPQATMPISSISQLCQLLSDEMEHYLLTRICELGTSLSESVNGTWFVDPVTSRSIGRWEGSVVNLRISYGQNFRIECSAFRMSRETVDSEGFMEEYCPSPNNPLMDWASGIVQKALLEETTKKMDL